MNKASDKYIIIVAGGRGSRMQSDLPKQFLDLNGLPVLMHTIHAFRRARSEPAIVVVLDPSMYEYWIQLCKQHDFQVPHEIAYGGNSRFQSVKNGLARLANLFTLENHAIIGVHDGARPLISCSQIDHIFTVCEEKEAVVLAQKSVNSVRIGTPESSQGANRETVWSVQTPQVFKASVLLEAYRQEEHISFTDDASVVEKTGKTIFLTEGDYRNIKITFPEDIDIAQLYLRSKTSRD